MRAPNRSRTHLCRDLCPSCRWYRQVSLQFVSQHTATTPPPGLLPPTTRVAVTTGPPSPSASTHYPQPQPLTLQIIIAWSTLGWHWSCRALPVRVVPHILLHCRTQPLTTNQGYPLSLENRVIHVQTGIGSPIHQLMKQLTVLESFLIFNAVCRFMHSHALLLAA